MKADIQKLLEEERAFLKPTAQENAVVKKAADDFVRKLDRALKLVRLKAKAVVGGSGAKGTWLRGMHDIDVFVCFDYNRYKEKSNELSEFLAAAMKKAFPKNERLHGSRDYFRTMSSGYNFEVVPILKITRAGQARNITDASLLHATWVKKQVAKKKLLEDEIRLTKAFAKAQRVYGAESYVSGFSGYACEVLTAYYGGFLKLITAAATKWKKSIAASKKIVVDAAGHYKRRDPLRELNEAKVQSELIVIDPVQAGRNATAALGSETLQRFVAAASAFMKNPRKDFFEREEITVEKLYRKAAGKQLVVVEARLAKGKEDVIGARFVKAYEHIRGQAEKSGFPILESGWDWNKKGNALLWFVTPKKEPEPELRDGPPLSNKVHAEKFREEHSRKKGRELFERNGKLYARIERRYKQLRQLISSLVKEDAYLKDKALNYNVI